MEEILDTVLSEYEERKEEKTKESPVDEKIRNIFKELLIIIIKILNISPTLLIKTTQINY